MRFKVLAVLAVFLIAVSVLAPSRAEEVEYYVWTDENGMIHATDQPPKDRDYETRTILLAPGAGSATSNASNRDSNVGEDRESGSSDTVSSQRNEPAGDTPKTRVTGTSDSGLGRALIADQVTRGEQGQGPDPTGHTSPPGDDPFNDVPRIPDVPSLPGLQGP